jgi:hypothetical protein
VPKSIKHLVLAAALSDLWRWLRGKTTAAARERKEDD